MLRFERTRDYELVRSIVTHPRIWPWHADDSSPRPAEFEPPREAFYLAVRDGDELLGLIALVDYDRQSWEAHSCLLPHSWGERARRVYAEGIAWIWRNTPKTRIIGPIRADNRLSLRIAERSGMKPVGIRRGATRKQGKYHDSIVMEIRKD